MMAAPCSASYDCSQIVCVGGIVAAVTKVQCVCDANCCLAMDQERP